MRWRSASFAAVQHWAHFARGSLAATWADGLQVLQQCSTAHSLRGAHCYISWHLAGATAVQHCAQFTRGSLLHRLTFSRCYSSAALRTVHAVFTATSADIQLVLQQCSTAHSSRGAHCYISWHSVGYSCAALCTVHAVLTATSADIQWVLQQCSTAHSSRKAHCYISGRLGGAALRTVHAVLTATSADG